MVWIWILMILLAAAGLWLYLIAPALGRPKALAQLHRHQYAHRGLHDIKNGVPENSLLAFSLAAEQGFAIELDVHISKDGALVVEHDDTLQRTCGSDLTIEENDWETIKDLRLEGTKERLPLLKEVLELIDGRVPLLIEAKVAKGSHNRLAKALFEMLKEYQGPYCIESFDPRPLLWFRKNAPEVVRGQLAAHVRKDGAKVSGIVDFALSNLLVNLISRPHFIAYGYKDYKNPSLAICRLLFRSPLFFWTVRDKEAATLCKRKNAAPIFEQMIP